MKQFLQKNWFALVLAIIGIIVSLYPTETKALVEKVFLLISNPTSVIILLLFIILIILLLKK